MNALNAEVIVFKQEKGPSSSSCLFRDCPDCNQVGRADEQGRLHAHKLLAGHLLCCASIRKPLALVYSGFVSTRGFL